MLVPLIGTFQLSSACSSFHFIISANAVFPLTSLCPDFFNQLDNTHLCSGSNIDVLTVRGGTLLDTIEQAEITIDGYYSCSEARAIASLDPYTAAFNPDSYSVRI